MKWPGVAVDFFDHKFVPSSSRVLNFQDGVILFIFVVAIDLSFWLISNVSKDTFQVIETSNNQWGMFYWE